MKYLILTKDQDYISKTYKRKVKGNRHCQVYDANGTLVYPAAIYDGEDREWAKEFIKHHKIGDSVKDAQVWFMQNFKWDYHNGKWDYHNGKLCKEEE